MKRIGEGLEGIVYLNNNEAIKRFYDTNYSANKEEKLKLLMNMNLENFIVPNELMFNNKGELSGYKMNFIKNDLNLLDFIKSRKSLDEKIELLKNLENMLINAHKNNITLVDLDYSNFLIDENNNLKAIDVDNYQVNNLKNDFNPTFYYNYYNEKVGSNIDSNMDKFSFTANIVRYLSDDIFYDFSMYKYTSENTYIEYFINNLDIPSELRDFLLNQVSSNPNKDYFGKYLDLLSSEKPYIKTK